MEMPQKWETLATHQVYGNRWIRVALDYVTLPDGRSYEYTRLEPVGIGVAVIGFNDKGELLLEQEYRHGVGEIVWQLPGGLAVDGEDLQTAGLRELREETGFAPSEVSTETVRYLGMVWDNPGFGLAQSHIYVAWGLVNSGETRHDLAEMVSIHWQSPAWVCEAVRSGIIRDRVVVAAVAHLLLNGWMG